MMISEKMVFTSSNGNHLVLYARPPAGISNQKCSVRSSFLLNEKMAAVCCRTAASCFFIFNLLTRMPSPVSPAHPARRSVRTCQ
jgi:hypothetical protein